MPNLQAYRKIESCVLEMQVGLYPIKTFGLKNTRAELLDIDFSVLTPNTMLSSPIFGFQDLIPDSKSNDKMIRTEDTYKEVLFHDQLDKQIDEFLTDENRQEVALAYFKAYKNGDL